MQTAAQSQATKAAPRPTQDYKVLKAHEKELKNQLSEVQDRRDEIARQASNDAGNSRPALDSRLSLLDQRITQIETDLTSVGKDLAEAAPASTVEPPPIYRYRGYDDGDMFGAGFAGASIMFALFVPFIIRNFIRRKRMAWPTLNQPAIAGERVDRMENAIDSIAVEIERVSENQRFMTRLLTETQLAGTIAAVRGSAEAAKAAAEASVNAK